MREATNHQQLQNILIFRNQIMAEELGISSLPPDDARHLDEIAREKVAHQLYLTAGNELAGYFRFYTPDVIGRARR